MKFAVIKTGGKQYIVKKDDELVVEHLESKPDSAVEFETFAIGDDEKAELELGKPTLRKKVKGRVLENVKGDKVRVARFRAKSRYRRVRGFRAHLSRIKITSI